MVRSTYLTLSKEIQLLVSLGSRLYIERHGSVANCRLRAAS